MSQIPYLARLGDALEASADRRRTATARILATAEERQAANFVYCADQIALNRA